MDWQDLHNERVEGMNWTRIILIIAAIIVLFGAGGWIIKQAIHYLFWPAVIVVAIYVVGEIIVHKGKGGTDA